MIRPGGILLPSRGPDPAGTEFNKRRRYFAVMRDAVSKMIAADKSVEQIQAVFKVPSEFAHYTGPARLKAFLNFFYHQLLERGSLP